MKAKLFFLFILSFINSELWSQSEYQWNDYNLSFQLFGSVNDIVITANNPEEFSGEMEGISFSIIPFNNEEMEFYQIKESINSIAYQQEVSVVQTESIEYDSFQGIWLEGILDTDWVIMVGITDDVSHMNYYIVLVLDNQYYKSYAKDFIYSIQKAL